MLLTLLAAESFASAGRVRSPWSAVTEPATDRRYWRQARAWQPNLSLCFPDLVATGPAGCAEHLCAMGSSSDLESAVYFVLGGAL